MSILNDIIDLEFIENFKSKGYVGFIYLTHDTKYNKFYIGKCEKENSTYRGSGSIIRNKISTERLNNGYNAVLSRFKCYYLEYCKTKEELYSLEKFYIAKYDATISEDFYNILDGGICGSNFISKLNEDELRQYKKEQSNKLKSYWKNITAEKYKSICESISDRRKNLDKDSKEKRKRKIQEVYSTGKHDNLFKKYSKERRGGGNPAAVKIIIEGVIYDSMKDAAEKLNIPYHIVTRRISSNKWPEWLRVQ